MSVEYSDPFDIVKDIHNILSDMRGKPWKDMDRKRATVEFCDSLARLWKVHPFREGNTRTTITFCCQYADAIGLKINRKLFEKTADFAEKLTEKTKIYRLYCTENASAAAKMKEYIDSDM